MTHGSLFSGIGGFDLAAQWCGWENKFHCEWNEFGQKILKHYWPQAESYGDITWTDFTKWRGQIDVLSGGFPCQPFSVAGKRLGTEDSRHLWPEMLRAIREIRPLYVVGENVRGILSWDEGVVFEQVHLDLEAEGYEVIAFVLPACGVNAPHRRERTWFVAHSKNSNARIKKSSGGGEYRDKGVGWETVRGESGDSSLQRTFTDTDLRRCDNENEQESFGERDGATELVFDGENRTFTGAPSERREERLETGGRENAEEIGTGMEFRSERFGDVETSSDTSSEGLRGSEIYGSSGEIRSDGNKQLAGRIRPGWKEFPTQSPVCGGDDGFSRQLDGITFPKWRSESIKAYGNAIVPQVAYEIFKVINQLHR